MGFFQKQIDGFIAKKTLKFFKSAQYSKFAAGWDRKRKNFQNNSNLGFFWKKTDGFFGRRNLEIFQNRYLWQTFSTMRLKWYFFLKTFFDLKFEVFWQKSEKNLSWKRWKI